MVNKILRVDASARTSGSVTRDLNNRVIAELSSQGPTEIVTRDLTVALPQINETWVGATFTPPEDRTPEQRAALALSDSLVAELKAADVVVIGVPIYNFGVPASLKAWIDQIARVGETFRYMPDGPVGLLDGKRAIVNMASGGVPVGSDLDFATGYLTHFLGFLGITDVTVITDATFDTALGKAA